MNFFVGGVIAWKTHQVPETSRKPTSSAIRPSGNTTIEIYRGGSSVPIRCRHLMECSHA